MLSNAWRSVCSRLGTPVWPQEQLLEQGVQIEGDTVEGPPGRIGREMLGGQTTGTQISLEHSMYLFAFTTACARPRQQCGRLPLTVGHQPVNLVIVVIGHGYRCFEQGGGLDPCTRDDVADLLMMGGSRQPASPRGRKSTRAHS